MALTEIIWYEFDIMAISMLRSTIMLITEYEPNMSSAQNRVNDLMPASSNETKSTRPKLAQKSDCEVSNMLQKYLCLKAIDLNFGGKLLRKSSPDCTGFLLGVKIGGHTVHVVAFSLL